MRPAPSGTDRALHLLALLAGLGAAARPVVDTLADGTPSLGTGRTDPGRRTCIDGGAPAVARVGGPQRTFDVHRPDGGPEREPGRRWVGVEADRSGILAHRRRTLFARGDTGVLPQVHAAVERAGVGTAFAAAHARLGPQARLFTLTEHDDGRVAVGWQLDGDRAPQAAFDLAGLGDAWRAAAEVLDTLHGFAVSRTVGPWSATITFGGRRFDAVPELRVGTTRWMRSVDDADKRRRAAAASRALGGDGAFVGAAFDLLAGLRPDGGPARVGRAVEVCLCGDRSDTPTVLDLYLAVPPHVRPASPTQPCTKEPTP